MAKYVERRVLELKPTKSQAEIAAQVGYTNANTIAMIKQGSSKVAKDRVPALAHALEVDLCDQGLKIASGTSARRKLYELIALWVPAGR